MDIVSRENCGISVVLEGELVYKHNGREYISDNSHILIYPLGQSYSWRCTRSAKLFVINFNCDVSYAPTDFLSVSVSNNDVVFEQCKILHNYFVSGIHSNYTYCMSVIYKILSMVDYNKKFDIPEILFNPISYIENNYKNPRLTVEEVAKNANISEIYLRKLFAKHCGISPMQYIKQLRLEKAKLMLSSNEKSIEQIAADVGYSCIYVFSRAFKQCVGVSPNKYRKDLYYKM